MFYAHSGGADRSSWQPLAKHLIGVADRAEKSGRRIGLGNAARLAGLMHDLGKYTAAFQGRLAGGERVDHSTAGARLVLDMAGASLDRVVAELVSYAIAGHHAGLPDRIGASGALEERLKRFDVDVLDPVWRREIVPALTQLVPSFEFSADKEIFAFQLGLLGRMIFSCLVDADFRDTEAHYATLENRLIDREWPALQAILPELTSSFDRRMAGLRNADTDVNRIRSHLLDHIRTQAPRKPGLFTLTVPTGGGKTLASLGFALDHAGLHGLDRIIYAIPFAGAWIETGHIGVHRSRWHVAPHAGAWIETEAGRGRSHAPVVAPHAGAWIETRNTRRALPTSASLPTRERGSKHCQRCGAVERHWSLPTREGGSKPRCRGRHP